MDERSLSQTESKLVADWLRHKKKVTVPNKLMFWKLRPASVADQLKTDFRIEITAQEVVEAARREA